MKEIEDNKIIIESYIRINIVENIFSDVDVRLKRIKQYFQGEKNFK